MKIKEKNSCTIGKPHLINLKPNNKKSKTIDSFLLFPHFFSRQATKNLNLETDQQTIGTLKKKKQKEKKKEVTWMCRLHPPKICLMALLEQRSWCGRQWILPKISKAPWGGLENCVSRSLN